MTEKVIVLNTFLAICKHFSRNMAPPLNLKILSLTGSDKHHGTLNISRLSLLTAGFSA